MEELENSWAPRKRIILDCPSGSRCAVRRPGPELGIKMARLQATLKPLAAVKEGEDVKRLSKAEKKKRVEEAFARATPAQQKASLDIMRETVAACVIEPRLYVEPKDGQVGVDDIPPEDFLYIFNWHQRGCPDVPVETDEGEVNITDVNRFPRGEGAGVGVGGDGGDVRAEAVAAGGD